MQTIIGPSHGFWASVEEISHTGTQRASVQYGNEEVARLVRRTGYNPTPGWFIWITKPSHRGLVRNYDGAPAYFPDVEDALESLPAIFTLINHTNNNQGD